MSTLPSPSPTSETFNQRDLPPSTSRLTALDSLYSQSPSFSSSSISSSSASSVDEPPSRALTPGIYVPTLTFFDPQTEDLDLPTIASHAVRLASARISGLTTLGSTGEAVHLTHSERALVTRTTRRALDAAGHHTLPLIVGCGAQSTRETIALCHEALHAGGDYALILPPSYYKASLSTAHLLAFFTDVADASPLPVLVYNYPAATSGTDLDSDALASLAAHPNIAGCKLTCGNTGKLARLAAATDAATPRARARASCASGGLGGY
ncbi:MAG: dihydrodipicolinate synthetase [Lasallia pustulata]|uniref:Dihydrodipicolinate synthetase n=1 Tax=Lasallia pustulata TaxID=136370 RepID=A0A5M8Q3P0_9LECA|nr:MAG: dihydrodipicolinate synthetase [Lasallia pustulata]